MFPRLKSSPRLRILMWAAVAGLAVGVLEAGAPIDRLLLTARELVRSRDSDRSIVVVKVDNASLRELGGWPDSRSVPAKALDTLMAHGARRVFFDNVFADRSPSGDDQAFADALRRYPGRAFLATRMEYDRATGAAERLRPVAPLAAAAKLGSINVWIDPLGYSSRVPYGMTVARIDDPSFSSLLAGVRGDPGQTFSPDYAIRANTIPMVSLLDAVRSTPAIAAVKGKDVIVGPTADSLGDIHSVPGQGRIPGVFIHVMAAETLKRGKPWNAGWPAPLAVGIIFSAAYLGTAGRKRRVVLGAAIAVLLLVPLVLDANNIATEVVPALVVLGVAAVRARLRSRRVDNPLTGLPTLDRIEGEIGASTDTIVALKIANFAELKASLKRGEEGLILREVVRRIQVGGEVQDLMHSADGLVWRTDVPVVSTLVEHVEGLYSMLLTPIEVGDRKVDLRIGFGIEADVDRPLVNRIGSARASADDALTRGTRWAIYDPLQKSETEFQLSLMGRMDEAIDTGEIWVAYQPKLDLQLKRLVGAEALVRWSHPQLGNIPPDRFIGPAEQANRIAKLTLFVLETAIRDLKALASVDETFSVAVNLSVRMLADVSLPEKVAHLLAKHDLAPERLTLEITESLEFGGDDQALRTLIDLRALGLEVSIDDYGTRYSTLTYVRQLPASEIKIDKSFIQAIHADESVQIMTQGTIDMAHHLGLRVVAEGVELPVTFTALQDMGVDVVQGYLISKPLTFEYLQRFVSQVEVKRAA